MPVDKNHNPNAVWHFAHLAPILSQIYVVAHSSYVVGNVSTAVVTHCAVASWACGWYILKPQKTCSPHSPKSTAVSLSVQRGKGVIFKIGTNSWSASSSRCACWPASATQSGCVVFARIALWPIVAKKAGAARSAWSSSYHNSHEHCPTKTKMQMKKGCGQAKQPCPRHGFQGWPTAQSGLCMKTHLHVIEPRLPWSKVYAP